MLKVWCEETP